MSKPRRRCGRPNPRWPLDPEIAGLVAKVRSAIAADPARLRNEIYPVAHVAEAIVTDHVGGRGSPGQLFALVLAEVVEAALADAAVRLMLAEQELHVCPLGPRCKGGGS